MARAQDPAKGGRQVEILVAVLCISVVELVVLGVTVRFAERADERRVRAEFERVAAAERARPRFMGDTGFLVPDRASLEALLAQLERHVRHEQQAAESFLRNPTAESLHHRPPAPFHLTH